MLIVGKNVKSHLSLTEVDPCTAESAIQRDDHREDSKSS